MLTVTVTVTDSRTTILKSAVAYLTAAETCHFIVKLKINSIDDKSSCYVRGILAEVNFKKTRPIDLRQFQIVTSKFYIPSITDVYEKVIFKDFKLRPEICFRNIR